MNRVIFSGLRAMKTTNASLHPVGEGGQAGRLLLPKSLNISVLLTLKLDSLCIIVIVVEKHLFVFRIILCC